MRDKDVRRELRRRLEAEHHSESSIILDEMGLCQGSARVDMVVINGAINGFEIKSESDSLYRLEAQMRIYDSTLDSTTIVVGSKHLSEVKRRVPSWWGIIEAAWIEKSVQLVEVRPTQQNPRKDSFSVAQLLWREEAWEILVEYGIEKGLASRPRTCLWHRLADSLTIDELSESVRSKLASRIGWRSD